ncbi:MAG: ABC-2 family transporter protein [Lachnospiraceae bacterium]|nr:ABC-2 family transporter protein [Lachnospiraceae bacterium]
MMKQGFRYYLKIYGKILVQNIKSKMSYRADFFISLIGIIFVNLSGFITFWIIFKNVPSLLNWSYYEMLFLYGFSLIALTPVQCFFDNNWNLLTYVFSGDFIKYCFKPLNLFFYYISEIFDIKGIGQLVVGITVLSYSWTNLGLDFSLIILVKLIIALVSASLFMISITNFAAASSFYILNSAYFVMMLSNKFKDYAKYPITIFGGALRIIFTFIIPIAFMAYYPSLAFLSNKEATFLTYFTPVYGITFFYLSYKFWMFGAMKYNGTGS